MIWLLYPLLTTALYYLGSRAEITRFLWERYPKKLDDIMLCSSCSGFWLGSIVGFLLRPAEWHWYTPVIVGLCSIVWTPLLADLHIRALLSLTPKEEE